MNDDSQQDAEAQRAFGKAFADFKSKTRLDSAANAAIPRCTEVHRWGTGTGLCDSPLDTHGNCPNAGAHVS